MNLWLRLLWLWLAGRWRTPVHPLGPCRTPFRVSLGDLDVFRHMNNGRYLTIMDIGRVDLMRRSGVLARINRAGFYPVVTAESITFRKSLNWPQPFDVETAVLQWDEKSVIMSQRFLVGNVEYASALLQARFLRRSGGSVPTAELFALVDEPLTPPVLDAVTTERIAGFLVSVRVPTERSGAPA